MIGSIPTGIIKKKEPFKEALQALSEIEISQPSTGAIDRPGGSGGGPYKAFSNPFMTHSMMASSELDPRRKHQDFWKMQGLLT